MDKRPGYTAGRHEHPAAYSVWKNMHQRCTNPNNPHYKDYGGRGIKVCLRWRYLSNFVEDMGDPPEGLSLDRTDNDGDYCKENCRWATDTQQARNSRRARVVRIKRREQCIADWCESSGVSYNTYKKRVGVYGWDAARALTTPSRSYAAALPRGAKYTYQGERKTLFAWSKDPRCEVSPALLYKRIRAGVELAKALHISSE